MELWDAYDGKEQKLGFDLIRGEKIPDGVYHIVCEVLARHVDGDYLLMQRDKRKPNYPGLFEASAGGSALKGENALQCAERELLEETGISTSVFTPIDVIISDDSHSIYHVYYCETDCDKESIRLQETETIDYKWVKKETLQSMLENGEIVPTARIRLRKYFENPSLF